MKKNMFYAASVLAVSMLAAICGSSVAGYVEVEQVRVDADKAIAHGSLYGARHSEDGKQYIFCRTQVQTPKAKPYIVCEARNSAGDELKCFSFVDRYIDLALNIDSHSQIYFAVEPNGSGNPICKQLVVETSSSLLP